ncbi:MAG: hypothetical protein K2W96_12410 [Gemmataceae bacterium]|nr:hypothetical protein [Gemmataceae bacterium]
MRERDESPGFIGLGRQAHLDHRHRHRETAGDRVHHRLCRFLRSQAGRRWDEVLPELDARLRTCGLARAHALEVRSQVLERLTGGRPQWRGVRTDGGTLKVEDGLVLFEPHNRKQRRQVATFSVAELRSEPVRIR